MRIAKTTPEDCASIIKHRKMGKSVAELCALFPNVSKSIIKNLVGDAGLKKDRRNAAATLQSFLR